MFDKNNNPKWIEIKIERNVLVFSKSLSAIRFLKYTSRRKESKIVIKSLKVFQKKVYYSFCNKRLSYF